MLDTLIPESHVHYEQALLAHPDNEPLWLDYAELCSGNFDQLVFVLSRAVAELPASEILWNLYLLLPWGSAHKETLALLYEKALVMFNKTPAYWFKYIELLRALSRWLKLQQALDDALFYLHRSHHGKVWKIYLECAENLPDSAAAKTYARYCESCHLIEDGPALRREDCVLRVARCGELQMALRILADMRKESPTSPELRDCLLELLESVLGVSDESLSFKIIHLADDAIKDFPESAVKLHLLIVRHHLKRDELDNARARFSAAVKDALLPFDFALVFQKMTNWEDEKLQDLLDSDNLGEAALRLRLLRATVDRQPLLLNDILLKLDVDCVDYWLQRAEIHAQQGNAAEQVNTFVQAIRSINPFHAHSFHNNTLSGLWIQYAEIYISQGDLATANIIFSRAVDSQFRSPSELAALHILWTEMIFSVSDKDAFLHIELVLLHSRPADFDQISYKDPKKTVQQRVFKSPELWAFYIDLLKAMLEEPADKQILEKISGAYKDMMTLKIITVRLILEYASFCTETVSLESAYAVYEMGIKAFESPEAQVYIWRAYIDQALHEENGNEYLRDLYQRCRSAKIPGHLFYDLAQTFIARELKGGFVLQAVRIMQDTLTYLSKSLNSRSITREQMNKIADDEFALYTELLRLVSSNLKDDKLYRDTLAEALQNPHLPVPYILELGLKYVEFELARNELERCRSLFSFMAGLNHPETPIMGKVWEQWGDFEVKNGNESTFRAMMKRKRAVARDFEDVSDVKSQMNPMGFVKSEARSSTTMGKVANVNPDAIELDMDM